MATRAERIAQLNENLADDRLELEFLNDSGTFYDLALGAGSKTILALDMTAPDGLKRLSATDEQKITSTWYKNYSGFTSAQEAEAISTYKRVKAELKMQRIHSWLYPSGVDITATAENAFKWVIVYDRASNLFVTKNVGENAGVDAPLDYTSAFYFIGTPGTPGTSDVDASADAEQAIALMKNSDSGSDELLRDLFGIINPPAAS